MQKYNRKDIDNLKDYINEEILVMPIAQIAVKLSQIDKSALNWAMAYTEFKLSNQIEGVYSTLFDAATIIKEDIRTVRPINIGNLSGLPARKTTFDKLAKSHSHNQKDRFNEKFGIYEKNKIIYKPLTDKDKLDKEYKDFWKLFKEDGTINEAVKNHIWFEKIHPYSDGNGRMGRYLLEVNISKTINRMLNRDYFYALPISAIMLKERSSYYKALDLNDKSVETIYKMVCKMMDRLNLYIDKMIEIDNAWNAYIQKTSSKISKEVARYISTNYLMTQDMIVKKSKLTRQTVSKIFKKLNEAGLYNVASVKGKIYYINTEIEMAIDDIFIR